MTESPRGCIFCQLLQVGLFQSGSLNRTGCRGSIRNGNPSSIRPLNRTFWKPHRSHLRAQGFLFLSKKLPRDSSYGSSLTWACFYWFFEVRICLVDPIPSTINLYIASFGTFGACSPSAVVDQPSWLASGLKVKSQSQRGPKLIVCFKSLSSFIALCFLCKLVQRHRF